MWDRVPAPQRGAIFARLSQHTLVGAIGEPEQIAMAHLYLMHNGYVTGTTLAVDGGSLLAAN
jgi:NAD(P)-dependent dehydrogenase (short-subunit alcohol dehydrogenase family)